MGLERAAGVFVLAVLAPSGPQYEFSFLPAQSSGGRRVIAEAQPYGDRAWRLALVFVYLVVLARHPAMPSAVFVFLTIILHVGMRRSRGCSTSAVSETSTMRQCLNPPSKASCGITRAAIGDCATSLPFRLNARIFTSVCGRFLPPQEQRSEISNAANGAGGSSAIDSFIAAFTCQAGFEYLSQRQPCRCQESMRSKD